MEKKDIYSQMSQLEEQMGDMFEHLVDVKKKLILVLEENKRLSIENAQLRKLLKRDTADWMPEEPPEEKSVDLKESLAVGEGYDNLARLYHEGFHICNVYYGHLRTEGDCLFCLSFLNK